VVLFTPSGHETRIGTFSNITFTSDNVEKSYEEMSARGVEFQAPPKKEHWGTSAIFKDPDGNVFLLSSK
jgi:predicted enzyme related to lactoylglutathione lyase